MRHRLVKALAIGSIATFVGCAKACPPPPTGNASGILVLLDYSKTFAPYDRATDAVALQELGRSISTMASEFVDKPVKILWTAFGDDGLAPFLPCGPARVFDPVLIGGGAASKDAKDAEVEIHNAADLETWLRVCQSSVVATSKNAQQFTDLSGAIAMAERQLSGTKGQKLVFVLSDFREDLPAGRQPPRLEVMGSRYVLVWRHGLDDANQPSMILEHVNDWRARLEKAGASRVCDAPSEGLTSGDITSCLTKK